MEVPPGQFSVFPQKSEHIKNCPKQTNGQSQFSFHKIPHYTSCVEVREHLYILKIKPTSILFQTLFLIVCQPFFLLFVPDERAMTIIPHCLRQCHTQSVNLSPVDGKECQGFVFNCPLMMQHRILSRIVFLSVLKSMDRYQLEKHY